jgi:carbon monoxide dehydrogenase subunit G
MARMEQTGEHRLTAPRLRVWEALNVPEVLRRCIDGSESLTRSPDGSFHAVVKARVGPLSTTFEGDVALKDLDPPKGYTMEIAAKGGAAGFARGEAKVTLAEGGDCTMLSYSAEGRVGGKLAQIGQRLIDAAARKTADDFFAAFAREVEGPEAPDTPIDDAPSTLSAHAPHALYIWVAVMAALAVAAIVAWQVMAH